MDKSDLPKRVWGGQIKVSLLEDRVDGRSRVLRGCRKIFEVRNMGHEGLTSMPYRVTRPLMKKIKLCMQDKILTRKAPHALLEVIV